MSNAPRVWERKQVTADGTCFFYCNKPTRKAWQLLLSTILRKGSIYASN